MTYRRLGVIAFYTCLLTSFFSCASDHDEEGENSGTLHVKVTANPEVVVGTNTRVDNATEQELPDVNKFAFSIYKGETLRGEWPSLTDFNEDDELTLRAGSNYLAVATYGDISQEGFALPCYEGKQPFAIAKGQTSQVTVECGLANAKLAILYTDEFRNYFETYTAEVVTALGNLVEYAAAEERYAYFNPGALSVRVKARKKEGYAQTVTFNVKNFTAEARHAYLLTLDVDAGTPAINIIFSDDVPNEAPVQIVVSDEALSAPAPYFAANGFDTTQALEVVEGKQADAPEVYAYLRAAGGIAHCMLTTHSTSLLEQGWPAVVDLTALSAETLDIMQRLGLRLAGLDERKDQIAKIDFTGVIPYLEYTDEGAEHLFELTATDRYCKENAEPFTLRVHSTDNGFALHSSTTDLLYGTTKMDVNLTLDGDPSRVTYWLKQGDTKRQVMPCQIESDGIEHTVTLLLGESQYGEVQIEANCIRRTEQCVSTVSAQPTVTLNSLHAGDVWAHSATLHSDGDADGWIPQYAFAEGATGSENIGNPIASESWSTKGTSFDGSTATFTQLASGTPYVCRLARKDAQGNIVETSNEYIVRTEQELQIPNAGFEDWYDEFVWKGTSGVGGNVEMYTFYPYQNGEQDPWWSTRNSLTTASADAGSYSYYYVVYPGTVSVTSSWAAAGKIGYPASPINGTNSAEIASVGWGKGSTCTSGLLGNKLSCKKVTAGALFIGTYADGQENYGHTFTSRPTQMSFSYRLHQYNGEEASASIRVEHREGDEVTLLGSGEVTLSGNENSVVGATGTVSLTYVNEELLPTHITVVFLSSNADSPGYAPYIVAENFSGNRYSRGIGNVLVIDDVNLKYEK